MTGKLLGYVVELEPGVWLAPWDGDPGRTLAAENAELFESHYAASRALEKAQKMRPFKSALISPVRT